MPLTKGDKVKTTWLPQAGGRKAVRDKFCLEHIRSGTPLVITDQPTGKKMTIPANQIEARRVGISQKAFPDITGGKPNYLWYFKFVPDKPRQLPL